jgi:hypothetical protein
MPQPSLFSCFAVAMVAVVFLQHGSDACTKSSSSNSAVLVSVSYTGEHAGMESIWLVASQAECIHVYTNQNVPAIPEDMQDKVVFIHRAADGQERARQDLIGSDWKGYHVVMEDTIVYPDE